MLFKAACVKDMDQWRPHSKATQRGCEHAARCYSSVLQIQLGKQAGGETLLLVSTVKSNLRGFLVDWDKIPPDGEATNPKICLIFQQGASIRAMPRWSSLSARGGVDRHQAAPHTMLAF